MRKYFLTASIVITSFLFGADAMYLIDSTWVYDKIDKNKERMNKKMERYIEALDVSQQLLNNSYDAFYTVSECSTSKGCDFKSTVDSLTELNIERKILQRRLDQLLEEADASRSAKTSIMTPIPPKFFESRILLKPSLIRNIFLKIACENSSRARFLLNTTD